MLKKSIFIIILLQFLSLLDSCCGGGRFEVQWVRFKMDIFDFGLPSNRVDSIRYQNLGGQVQLVDVSKRIGVIHTGLTQIAYSTNCAPDEVKPLTSIQNINIFTLTDLANQIPARNDVTNLFIDADSNFSLDSTRIMLNEANLLMRTRNFFRFRFQPPFVVHQVCRFRVEIKMSDGLVMQQETSDLKLF